MSEMNTNHTAQHIYDKLTEVYREWGISLEKIAATVTQCMKYGLEKKYHFACFAHTLSLIAKNLMKSIVDLCEIILKVQSIVTFIRESVNASVELRLTTEL